MITVHVRHQFASYENESKMIITGHSHTGHFTPTQNGKHTEETPHTTEDDNHISDYEDRNGNENEARSPTYEIDERIPGRVHPDYNGYEHEMTTKWYHPKTTDNRVVPPESEFFATIVGEWLIDVRILCKPLFLPK